MALDLCQRGHEKCVADVEEMHQHVRSLGLSRGIMSTWNE